MTYQIAERFKSVQGEGVYTGTPMAFIRFVGCSVGKKICQHCDTDFEKVGSSWRGGGEFDEEQLLDWVGNYQHICLTGGEPLDQDLEPLLEYAPVNKVFHLETSGTKELPPVVAEHRMWLVQKPQENVDSLGPYFWVCVSPKPGFRESVVRLADEVKVIVPGLGTPESLIKMFRESPTGDPDAEPGGTFHWPTLEDALRWAGMSKTVFLQPRNAKYDVDKQNLLYVQDVIAQYPQLRLSVQMHKILRVQ